MQSLSPKTENSWRLTEIRNEIDLIDKTILDLLNRRASCSLEAGKLKAEVGAPIYRPVREGILLEELANANAGPLPNAHLRAIFREILSSSRALQKPLKVAFLGPDGTFSHMAATGFFGSTMDFWAAPRFEDIFEAVEKRESEIGVVPLENSLHGTVVQNIDLFAKHDVHIQAEWFSRISHSVLARETSLAAIKTVYSHTQALGQCAEWLRMNLPAARIVSMDSTAAAAHKVLAEDGAAALGHHNLASRLGLCVLADNVEDISDNWTRFVAIGPAPVEKLSDADNAAVNKTSVLFTLPDKPGSLASVLQRFAEAGVNMNKLESRPLKSERWKYIFFCDVACDLTTERLAPLLHDLRGLCHSFRILGAYPTGIYIHDGEKA